MWPRGWVEIQLYSFMTAALEGGEWSAARPGRNLPPAKTRYPFYRRLGGPQGRSGRAEKPVPTRIRSRTVQPVVSRYTDWATGPTLKPRKLKETVFMSLCNVPRHLSFWRRPFLVVTNWSGKWLKQIWEIIIEAVFEFPSLPPEFITYPFTTAWTGIAHSV